VSSSTASTPISSSPTPLSSSTTASSIDTDKDLASELCKAEIEQLRGSVGNGTNKGADGGRKEGTVRGVKK
jgi:hypothetical protein